VLGRSPACIAFRTACIFETDRQRKSMPISQQRDVPISIDPKVATVAARKSSLLSRLVTRAVYGATQLPRVAWYVGHGLAMRRLSQRTRRRAGEPTRPRAHTDLAVPDRSRLYADMASLLQQDLANVEAGIYPLPTDRS
jgi:hypothetical protein